MTWPAQLAFSCIPVASELVPFRSLRIVGFLLPDGRDAGDRPMVLEETQKKTIKIQTWGSLTWIMINLLLGGKASLDRAGEQLMAKTIHMDPVC